jgi:predicted nucleic-acid-binding protein
MQGSHAIFARNAFVAEMLGLDTNLLIRYLVRDDPAQFGRARAEIEAAANRGEPLMINAIVLCEVVWVLGSAYEYSRTEIANALEQILSTAQFVIEWGDEARQALQDCRTTKAGFTDAFIGRINSSLQAAPTMTFDRDLAPLSTFRVLQAAKRSP